MRQHFPVLYARLSRLLYFVDTPDTYVRFFWEWKTRDLSTLAPDTKEEKRKKRIFIRDCTRSTRSNERMNPGIQKKRLLSRLCARTTRLYTRHAVFRCIRHARLRLYYSRWDYPEPFPATTTTTLYCLRLYALTHIYTHAVRNRSEMFDLLHVLSTAEKGLVSTDFQFIGIKDEGQRAIRNGSFIMDYMEKCENYIFKLYLFSTAAGRISFTEDSIYT